MEITILTMSVSGSKATPNAYRADLENGTCARIQRGFLSDTGPDPLKDHKATKLAVNVGPSSALQRNAI